MTDTQTLTRYKAWADDRLLTAVGAIPGAELTAPRPIVFGSLIRTLHHVYAMDFVWQCHLTGKPHGLTTRSPEHCPSIEEISASQRTIDAWYVSYADSMTPDELDRTVDFEFIGGGAGRMSRRAILLHVVNHGSYHRGHAASMLNSIGASVPVTDLPVFLRDHASGG